MSEKGIPVPPPDLDVLPGLYPTGTVSDYLARWHYLGPTRRGLAWVDEHGTLVISAPTSRSIPGGTFLELSRWCLASIKNGGSRQWARAWPEIAKRFPECTTVISYSDPSVGHTGSLYRACNWLWAPTWHRLRPPPTGNGDWGKERVQSPKDRWVFLIRPDPNREKILAVNDEALIRRHPEWSYKEPRWKNDRPVQRTGGADYASFSQTLLTR